MLADRELEQLGIEGELDYLGDYGDDDSEREMRFPSLRPEVCIFSTHIEPIQCVLFQNLAHSYSTSGAVSLPCSL